MSVRFTQSCPTCGRRIQFQTSLLGCTVACQHCKAEFVAQAGIEGERERVEPIEGGVQADDELMDRVEKALARADQDQATAVT